MISGTNLENDCEQHKIIIYSVAATRESIRIFCRQAVKSCFAQAADGVDSKSRCVLALLDLKKQAWEDEGGPLRLCSLCRTFAKGAIKALLSTPANEQKCVRTEVYKAVAKAADYCLRQKKINFAKMPDFPDFEEGSFAYRNDVISSVSDHIVIHSRLAFCNDRRPERANATRECLKNPFAGYLEKHCGGW
ncbi:unnamed protein product [Gongylonema pulchrum]|uniref:Saposin B-type domain-containing protein n=1 Tax=Gongylonema pulchrum TaxID=637853 RepID=A0A183DYJ3_9BILA|nr:unnamed protein product [Gongylonema pulchrum]